VDRQSVRAETLRQHLPHSSCVRLVGEPAYEQAARRWHRSRSPAPDALGRAVPGKYKLLVTYEYDRQAAKAPCPKNTPNLEKPDRPWNRALEVQRKFEAEMTITQ